MVSIQSLQRGQLNSFRCLRSLSAQQRTFTNSSSSRARSIPKFHPSSSVELDAYLAKVRRTVIIPKGLSYTYRKLVYSKKHKNSLEQDPVKVTIGDEEFRLEHIDRTVDSVGIHGAILHSVSLMKVKKDWDNFIPLIEGLATRLPRDRWEQLIRKAAKADRLDVILECARRSSKTLFSLAPFGVSTQLMRTIVCTAINSGWNVKETSRALGRAEQMAILLENEDHHSKEIGGMDPRSLPEIIGGLLLLSSKVAKSNGGDADGKVSKYAERLVSALDHSTWYKTTGEQTLEKLSPYVRNVRVADGTIILNGMQNAIEVLGAESNMGQILSQRAEQLEAIVGEQVALLKVEMEDYQPLGLFVYADFLESKQ